MEWSVELLYWFNTALPGVMGAAVLLTRRWRHLRWFPIYALLVFLMNVVYLTWLYNYPFYWIKHLSGELLALGVVVEVLRKEANKRPLWPWLALASLASVYFLPIDGGLKFYLPQEIFAIGLALELPTALRIRSAPLLAWAVIGSATVVSDLIKFLSPWEKIHEIMRMLDPIFFTIFGLILLCGIFWPELSALGRRVAAASAGLRAGPQPVEPLEETAGTRREDGGNIAMFPLKSSTPTDNYDMVVDTEISKDRKLELISKKLDALDAAVETAAMLSLSLKKPFLSPQDLSLYLGADVDTAKRFVEKHGITKIHLTDNKDEWVVFRADVDSALGEE
jgi:hypothetical protein